MAISKILSDLLEQDKFAKFTKTGNTTATLGSLTLGTAISGPGGIDTGSVAASTFYYVYTIVHSNSIKLIASTSSTSPTGFTQYKKVGAFYTDSSSNIFKAYYYGERAILEYVTDISVSNVITTQTGPASVISSTGTSTKTITFVSNLFSITPIASCDTSEPTSGGFNDGTTTTTGVVFVFYNYNVSLTNIGFILRLYPKGIDAVQPDWFRLPY